MPIGNLNNKISRSDAEKVKEIRNPPEFEPGFEPSDGDTGFGSIFSDSNDMGDLFGDSGGSSGGGGDLFGSPSQDGSGGGGTFGSTNVFGSQNALDPFGMQSGLGMQGAQQQPVEQKPDMFDKAFDTAGEAAKSAATIMMELVKSLKNRTADDFGYLSRNLIIVGGACTAVAVVLGIFGTAIGLSILKFSGLPAQLIGAGLFTVATGLGGMAFAASMIAIADKDDTATLADLPDVSSEIEDDATVDYEDNIGDILDDLFDTDFDSSEESEEMFSTDDFNLDESENNEDTMPDFGAAPVKIDFEKTLTEVKENQYLSRETLFNTFKPFFPCNTPTFADSHDIDPESDEFNTLETIALKALSNVAKCELDEVKSHLESATETYFSYELRLKRIRGINKIDDIEREMEAYFRDSSSDTSVNATVDIEGDFYKVIVTKGESAVVTFGDVFRQQYACDFVLDTGNKLPIITGISEMGKVILDDAKVFDTMMIAGKPRSGKSWYVLSILMMLALFNTPEDVVFIVIDPKESNLFNTFALLPHVLGLHNDERVLDIMEDIIVNEGGRRKNLLADNKCDDIWAIRKKGIKLPVLYLVIDEYITIKNNLGSLDKELDVKLQTIISQLPSLGIRLLFVPHRATGVVNRTNRTMLSYTASVKGDIDDVKDTLGIKQWTRSLTKPGDIAIKTSVNRDAMYVRGAALTPSDEDNTELIKNAAKAFYKMGVDMPDTSSMKIACNRDAEMIREELSGEGERIQFDATNVFNDLDGFSLDKED